MNKKVYVFFLAAFIVFAFMALKYKYSPKTTNTSEAVALDWSMTPSSITDLSVPVTFTFHLKDQNQNPVTDAKISVEANMNHAGMIPVKAEAIYEKSGTYKSTLKLTMDGDWILFLTIAKSDGEIIKKELFFTTKPK